MFATDYTDGHRLWQYEAIWKNSFEGFKDRITIDPVNFFDENPRV
jgi:hypothetical protein